MNEFEESLIHYLGIDNLKKIQNVKIGIAGAGGLGSNAANYLVRSGIKNLKIVDFDIVEIANLNRQFYFHNQLGIPKVAALKENLLCINNSLQIEAINEKITEMNVNSIFSDCNIIVEAFDKAIFKALIVNSTIHSEKLIVAASGLAGIGNSDNMKIKKINKNFYVVGDLETEVRISNPPMAPRVNIAAAKQADIVLEYILKDKEI